jgi:hypothetical protein
MKAIGKTLMLLAGIASLFNGAGIILFYGTHNLIASVILILYGILFIYQFIDELKQTDRGN